jgi:hypothetical protein
MKTLLQVCGFDGWKEVVDKYKAPATPPTDKDGKKLCENNLRDTNAILSGLASLVYVKVMHCDSAKDI